MAQIVDSNNNKNVNLTNPELKLTSYSRVSLSKGRATIHYRLLRGKQITEWQQNQHYVNGDVVCVDPKKWNDGYWSGRHIDSFKLWSMCINDHISNNSNKPEIDEIFNDLVINIIPYIKIYLIEYVKGFNQNLCEIIISLCYKTNKFWWNGCYHEREKSDSAWRSCGNLVIGFDTKHCRVCKNKKIYKQIQHSNDDKFNLSTGSKIKLNKNDNKNKQIENSNDDKKEEKNKNNTDDGDDELTWKCPQCTLLNPLKNKMCEVCDGIRPQTVNKLLADLQKQKDIEHKTEDDDNKNIILVKDITSKMEKEKLCNLLTRNFNKSMKELIKCCIDGKKIFLYKNNKNDNKDIKINIGDTKLWSLYSTENNLNELLCGLIWRCVRKKNKLMFEILFLSTYENVRHKNYGKKMAKQIELYARSNCYDLIAVAAVPGHGEGFWKKNGFEMRVKAENDNKSKKSNKDKSASWLQQNMLVFDDTPLFAKYMS